MIRDLTAEDALDAVGRGTVLLCFASPEDLVVSKRMLDRLATRVDIEVVRVKPDVDAARTLQLIRHPTFILYRDGNEVESRVGTDSLNQLVAGIFK